MKWQNYTLFSLCTFSVKKVVRRIKAKRSKLTISEDLLYILVRDPYGLLANLEKEAPLQKNLQKILLRYSTFSSGPFWASFCQTKAKLNKKSPRVFFQQNVQLIF